MSWYFNVWKKYAVFSGRARRKEYWMFVLFNLIAAIILMVLDNLFGTNFTVGEMVLPYGFLYLIYMLAIIIPSLAVAVRRLHDTDRSGGWIFISLVPFIGGIWLLVLMCLEGTRGANRFGEDPKENAA
jgi:uncharacterized membrane protein YhaH (DUF805 family)